MTNNNGQDPDVQTILHEAEQIRAGVDPATVSADTASPTPASSAGSGEEGAASSDVAPSQSFEQLADLACLLCDWPFVRAFGPSAQLAEPFRTEAQKAWLAVMEKYLPAVVGQTGPLGVLASIYLMHGAGLYLAWQIHAPVAGSSEKEVPANQP
jgi:hypothetical protein